MSNTEAAGTLAVAARAGAGVFDLSGRLRLEVTGPDRQTWLQGMVTNDLAALEPGAGCAAGALTAKGKLVGELRIYVRPEALWIEAEADSAARRATPLFEHLSRYIIMEDCALRDVSRALAAVALVGPHAAAVAAQAFGPLPELAAHAQASVADGGLAATAIGWPELGLPGVVFWLAAGDRAALIAKFERAGAVTLTEAAAEVLRVEAGHPREGHELDGEVIPLEARLDAEISDRKGCYLGQEVIARVSHRGHVNRKLVGLKLSGALPEGLPADLRHADRVVGELRSAVHSTTLGENIALGYVRRELLAEGTELLVHGGTATVVALPFVA